MLRPGVRLLIAEKGDKRARLEDTVTRCGVTGQVVVAGGRADVAAMLSAMDLFIASSRQETLPLSVLEPLN